MSGDKTLSAVSITPHMPTLGSGRRSLHRPSITAHYVNKGNWYEPVSVTFQGKINGPNRLRKRGLRQDQLHVLTKRNHVLTISGERSQLPVAQVVHEVSMPGFSADLLCNLAA